MEAVEMFAALFWRLALIAGLVISLNWLLNIGNPAEEKEEDGPLWL